MDLAVRKQALWAFVGVRLFLCNWKLRSLASVVRRESGFCTARLKQISAYMTHYQRWQITNVLKNCNVKVRTAA